MSKEFKPTDLTLSATSSIGDMFTSSVNYVKKQTNSFSWEQIFIVCLFLLLVCVIRSNRSKDRVIRRQSEEIRRSRSISQRFTPEYDD
jgi:hypothetical protein